MNENDKITKEHIEIIQRKLHAEGLLYGEPSATWTREAIESFKVHQRRNNIHFPHCNNLPRIIGDLNASLKQEILKNEELEQIGVAGVDSIKVKTIDVHTDKSPLIEQPYPIKKITLNIEVAKDKAENPTTGGIKVTEGKEENSLSIEVNTTVGDIIKRTEDPSTTQNTVAKSIKQKVQEAKNKMKARKNNKEK